MNFMDHSVASPHFGTDKLKNAALQDKIDVFEDQVLGWIIDPAKRLLPQPHCDRAALMIAVSYFEAVACYLGGRESDKKSERFFRTGLLRVFPEIEENVCGAFTRTLDRGRGTDPEQILRGLCRSLYRELRCGLYHVGLARAKVCIWPGFVPLAFISDSSAWEVKAILIDPARFVERIEQDFGTYIRRLRSSDERWGTERENFERLWDARYGLEPCALRHGIRASRGAKVSHPGQ
jgi:hypothetical protein